MVTWSYITLFVCFWDFFTFVLLGVDYDRCLYYSGTSWGSDVIADEGVCANVILPVFFIASKGFVLWIVNIVLAVIVLRTSKQMITLN